MATLRLFLTNLRYRYQEWRSAPRVYYVSLSRLKREDTRRDW